MCVVATLAILCFGIIAFFLQMKMTSMTMMKTLRRMMSGMTEFS